MTAYENHEGSMRQLAIRFRLSLRCVRDLLTRYRATGDVAPRPHGGGYPAKLDAAGLDTIRTWVQQAPDATLKELCMRLQATTQLTVSSATMSRVLTKLGLPRKKTFRAAEQERPDIQQQRADFLTRLQQMAMAGVRGCQRLRTPVPGTAANSGRGKRKLAWGSTKLWQTWKSVNC